MADETFELTNNLENLLSPFCYAPETSLPKTNPEVPGGMYLSGFISQDCTWGCSFNHSVIKCFPVDRYFEDNHASFAAHSCNANVAVSSSSYTFTGGHITCATELAIHNLRTSSGMRKLLLGISFASDNSNRDVRGAVVLFDPIRCAPMKWIEIPDPVSSITVLSHFEEGGSSRPFFNETMMAMVGIAAVGLRGGSVIIIDLGLDDPNLSSVSASDCRGASDLTYRLLYVNPHEYVIATKRHKAVSKRSLISLKFTNEPEDEMIEDAFHYCKPTGESLLVLHKNSVAVTCLEYVPAIGSLLVGFTCGGFQIWRVNNMELQFSSEPVFIQRNEPAHVFGFSFQQPVDDPKNYCYIWVIYGNKSAECTNTHVELHSLYFEQKNYIENFGFVYDGFKECAKRMRVPLLDDFLGPDSENEESESIRCSARPIRIWTQPESDLMYCAWEVGRGGIFYLGAFDLNQWYSNHTKEHIFYHPDSGLCPYWVALPVDITDVSNFVMDVRIIPKSLMRWENPHAKLDVHLYPASVSFRAVVLTNTGVSSFEHFGVQEKLVRMVLRDGPSLMIHPENIKNLFMRYGLEPVFPHVYGEHLSRKDQDRFFILTVLLENRRTPAIIRLASTWLDGSFANVGCTIDLIIDWIGGYMVALRGGADEHWSNLFNFADGTLPPETVRYINFSNFAWTSLYRLLLTIMGPSEVYTVRTQELENMEFGLGKLVQYSAALLMMFKARLLPECDRSFISTLTDYYQQRRLEAKTALESCVYIDSQLKKSHPLMIDHLMDALMADEDLREEWHVEEGQHCYPPQHVGYLVNMFMWPEANAKAISRVFMYFLIDLTLLSPNADASNSIVERKVRGDFKAVMDSSAEEYQEIYELWLLDHGSPSEILVHLKENDRLYQNDGLPWCAAAVALTAAGYENDVAELLLKSCPRSLAKLLFSLMTSSVSKYSSLAELMISSNLSAEEDLLQQFFEISETRERLAEFIRTKSKELPQRVKRALLAFLGSSNSVRRMSQLLMFYVHTEDYNKLKEEFMRVRDALKDRNLSEPDRKLWRFQETYINHLLNTSKGSMVQTFLRLQGHQNVRAAQTTISIKAVPAPEDLTLVEDADRIRNESKLPLQLRRLKHSESVVNDPLSPLRRYAGRIQNAVSVGVVESEEEKKISRRLSSRKSFSRRFSVSMTHQSFTSNANGTFNETLPKEDRLNNTSRNSHVDLMSLLKTPAVDHRVENRQRASFILNHTVSHGIDEDGANNRAGPSRHSIMKEIDPSKPKVTKKVELRFENLSLSSEEDDEKNTTVYEDADENLEDENVTKSVIEASLVPESASSSFNFDTTQENMEQVDEEIVKQQPPVIPLKGNDADDTNVDADDTDTKSSRRSTRSTRSKTPTRIPEQVHGESPTNVLRRETRASKTPTRDVSADEANEDDEQHHPPLAKKKRGSSIQSIGATEPASSSFIFEITQLDMEQVDEKIVEQPPVVSENINATDAANVNMDESDTKSTRRSTRSTRSKTPTRVLEQIPDDTPTNVLRRETRASKTPSRDVSADEASKDDERHHPLPAKRKRGSSIQSLLAPEPESSSLNLEIAQEDMEQVDREIVEQQPVISENINATDAANVDVDESDTKSTRRSTRSTRSKTPTRILEQVSEESPTNVLRRETRASKTPSRDVSADEANKDDEAHHPPLAKKTRGSLIRSIVAPEPLEPVSSSFNLEIAQEEMEQVDKEIVEQPSVISENVNTTDAANVDGDESDTMSTRRSTRSTRSKTPTRVLEQAPEESPAKVLKRKSRASKTPSRDVSADEANKDDEQRHPQRTKRKRGRSIQPIVAPEPASSSFNFEITQLDMEQVDEKIVEHPTVVSEQRNADDAANVYMDESDTKSTRRSTRCTRSKTPTRVLEQIPDDTPTNVLRRETRASKTPSRDVSADEANKDDEPHHSQPAKRKRDSVIQSIVAPEPVSTSCVDDETIEQPPAMSKKVNAADAANVYVDESDTKSTRRSTRSTRSKTPTRNLEQIPEESPTKASRRETRASKTPSRDVSADEANKDDEPHHSKKKRGSLIQSIVAPEPESSSFNFEITQEDMEQMEEEIVDQPPVISKKVNAATTSKARKRRLKFLQHNQDLSTVIEDSETERSGASVLEATVAPSTSRPHPPKSRKIKGIKVRPAEEPSEPESGPSKPTKRRKAAALVADFDEDNEIEVNSLASSRSTRSASSRRSTGSTKAKTKTSRRKGRTSSNSTT